MKKITITTSDEVAISILQLVLDQASEVHVESVGAPERPKIHRHTVEGKSMADYLCEAITAPTFTIDDVQKALRLGSYSPSSASPVMSVLIKQEKAERNGARGRYKWL